MQYNKVQQKRKVLVRGILYHIIQRAPGKELLFLEDSDYLRFLSFLKTASQKFSFNIYAFCLMPNHLHMLGSASKDNFSEAMQYLFKRYALYFNSKYQRKGHVFHGVFRVVPCLDDKYLLTVSLYIHLNAYKANLCQEPEEWRWSSLKLYYQPQKESFVDPQKVLSLFQNNGSDASREYKNIISSLMSKSFINVIEDKNAIKKFFANCYIPFMSIFKEDLFKKEFEIDQMLQKDFSTRIETNKARMYAITQLLSRGYDRDFICNYLGLSRTSFYEFNQAKPGRKCSEHFRPDFQR